ncbi:MAG TPA: NUDIX hydrolase [Anaerolineae bacterium]|nr:NUDIX hydrolase [Anaerolineae bacterium]
MTERLIYPEEVEVLARRFGEPHRKTCTMDVTQATYDAWTRKITTGPVACRGEVIMVIVRPSGNVLLHTKDFYPTGVYRLLTGRVLWPDDVEQTLHREVREETSLEVNVDRLLGLIDYEFQWNGKALPFVSYVFELHEIGGELCCIDTDEGITEFREATINELSQVARQLEQLEPRWHDWGNFRAVAHYMVQTLLPR